MNFEYDKIYFNLKFLYLFKNIVILFLNQHTHFILIIMFEIVLIIDSSISVLFYNIIKMSYIIFVFDIYYI